MGQLLIRYLIVVVQVAIDLRRDKILLLDLVALANGAKLQNKCDVNRAHRFLEELFEGVEELHLHPVQVLDGELQQVALLLGHARELAHQLAFLLDPVFEVVLVLRLANVPDDVMHAKVAAFLNIDILGVLVARQNKAAVPVLEEVNTADCVSLKENVLVLRHDSGLEQWADPRYEYLRLLLEKADALVQILVKVD
jgi:hypothetical protein